MKSIDFQVKNQIPGIPGAGLWVLFAFLLSGLAQPLYAVEVAGLYQGTVTVQSRVDERERQRAFTETFRQVLVKITGTQDIVNQPVIGRALRSADDYVDTWSYQANTQEAGTGTIELVVNFFEPEVLSLLDALPKVHPTPFQGGLFMARLP